MRRPFKCIAKWTCVAVLGGMSGCVPVAALLDKVSPEPTEPAHYVPEKQTLLVLVEDYQNPALVEVIAEHIDRLIVEELIAHKVAPVVNPDRLTLLRTNNVQDYRQMKLPAIGRELDARQILYVDITEFAVDSAAGTEVLKGRADARVKIVDSITGQTRWPKDSTSAGYALSVEIPFAADSRNVTPLVVRSALGAKLAERVSRLFYEATAEHASGSPAYPETD